MFETLHNLGIVPVVKIDDAGKAVNLAKAMIAGGLPCAEVTFRTDAAEEAIRLISKACPEMILGAGTVLNPATAERAVNAGARFIVSPGFDEDTVRWCQERNIPVVPGLCTPSEIQKAINMGLNVLKFFPAEASGGVGMLKNFAGPFPGVKFMTTGGINQDNLASYAQASNVLAIGGSWMVKDSLINNEQWDEITRLCAEAVVKLQGLQFLHLGVNCENEEESEKAIAGFAAFGMSVNRGNSSVFMDKAIEVMPKPGRGKCGHIAYKCYDLERTVYFMEKKGFTVAKDSIKFDAKGKMKVCYFNEELGGFAIHLVK
jgi:Entner-Doudoroff aldolase